MQAIFSKVISFILSLLMPITGFFSGGTPVSSSDILVLDGVVLWNAQIISTYEDFQACFGTKAEENSFLKSIDESYFENGNLAVISVTLADTAEEIGIVSATENGDKLTVSYTIEESGAFGATMLCYSTVCVKTSKNITQVEAVEKGGFTSIYRSVMGYLIEAVK